MNTSPAVRLTKPMQDFVRHWGEMGARWGVNRSIAQIHALLYLADRPLSADEIVETLAIARSNVSTGLKELQGYGLVELTHQLGDRRDHFRARQDPWEMLIAIAEERKKREIDPTLAMMRDCVDAADRDPQTSREARQRLAAMLELLEQLEDFYSRMRRLPRPMLRRLVKLGDRVAKLVVR